MIPHRLGIVVKTANETFKLMMNLFILQLFVIHIAYKSWKMCDIYSSTLSDKEKVDFGYKIIKFIENDDDSECQLWTGLTFRNGYGKFATRFRGRDYRLLAHRVCFFIYNGFSVLSPSLHVSHLCHRKICVNFEHLSLEPASINNSRKTCLDKQQCTGHDSYAKCIFH